MTASALLLSGAAHAGCHVALDSHGGVWQKNVISNPHFIVENGDQCFLNLANSNPKFRITHLWIDQDARHGKVEAAFPTPSKTNAFIYTPSPGFHGDETVIVHFDTEVDGQPSYPRTTNWRITVQ